MDYGCGMCIGRPVYAAANDYLQRKRHKPRLDHYHTANDAEALFAHSNKGFLANNLALEWLHRFGAWTSIRAAGAPRFLLLDGHHTHYSLQFMCYVTAVARNIVLMSYPGRSTHLRAGTRKDRKSTRLNSSHAIPSRMPSSA